MLCRCLLYFWCHSVAPTAREDLEDATNALLRLNSTEEHHEAVQEDLPNGSPTGEAPSPNANPTGGVNRRPSTSGIDMGSNGDYQSSPEIPGAGQPSEDMMDGLVDVRPRGLHVYYYNQAISPQSMDALLPKNVVSCSAPGGLIGYGEHVRFAECHFKELFPDEDFFPIALSSALQEDPDDEALRDLESALTSMGVTRF